MSGIDYSPRGSTINRDPATGIRYGIINIHSLAYWLWDDVEDHYSPHCPYCGTDLEDADVEACPNCGESFDEDDAYGDEPDTRTLQLDGVEAFIDSYGDLWVVKSPYYTQGTFCSPCAPGAVSIDAPCDDGARAYCVPHSWYEDNKAPGPVYRVDTGKPVPPEKEEN